MSDIVEATYVFLDSLDNSEIIKNITKYKNKLLKNKDLLFKINIVKNETDNNKKIIGRKEIYDNDDYKTYMKYYNELLLIVMSINKKYKEYTNTYSHNCHK